MKIFGEILEDPQLIYLEDDASEIWFLVEEVGSESNVSSTSLISEFGLHTVVYRGPLADSVYRSLEKGALVHLDGEISTSEIFDDETGNCFCDDEFVASKVKVLGVKKKSFTYVEAGSALYGPDGVFLKQLYCPKALHWNQLLADDPEGRSRGCSYCSKRVINLDAVDPSEAVQILKKDPVQCVFGTEKSIRFLQDPKRPPSPKFSKNKTPVVIHTARTVLDINRGAASGFWPDVRLVTYDKKLLGTHLLVFQNTKTGVVEVEMDARFGRVDANKWKQVVYLENYYQYSQEMPIAAYLVPKRLPPGSEVLVPDPIDDILGADEGQGTFRAKNVKGVWDGEKIILDLSSVKVSYALG